MKKMTTIAILALTISSGAHAFNFGSAAKLIKLGQCLAANNFDPSKCLTYLDDSTARSAGIFTYTAEGRGDNENECKQDALSKVEVEVLVECEKKNLRSCNLMGTPKYNNNLSDNPAVTIGGLSGKRKTCSATAYAKPN